MAYDPYSQALINIFNQYWYLFLIAVIAIFILWFFLSRRKGKGFVQIDRSDIEREKFIVRNKYNYPDNEHYLYRAGVLLGRIMAIKTIKFVKKPTEAQQKGKDINKEELKPEEELTVFEIVAKPTLFGWRVPFAFGREVCIIQDVKHCVMNRDNLILKQEIPLHMIFGIYYDESLEDRGVEFIKNDYIIRTDYENFASVSYTKAMEQSTLDPEHAHEVQHQQLEIENEKARRERLTH